MDLKINARVVLSALCYALEQALSSGIEVTTRVNCEADAFRQFKEIAHEINKLVPLMHEHWLEQTEWYNKDQVERVTNAQNLEECFVIIEPDVRNLFEDDDL